jgi:hypothetical protein
MTNSYGYNRSDSRSNAGRSSSTGETSPGADLEQEVRPAWCPAHLLLLDHPIDRVAVVFIQSVAQQLVPLV